MDLLERSNMIKLAESDPNVASAARQMAKNDVVDFINAFGWVYEPRSGREHHVMVDLYLHEVDLLRWLEERYVKKEDGLIEKSRDMGVTWTVAVFWTIWHWLFDEDFDALIGSRKEDLVDNRLPDSIFGKLDYFITHLPVFLRPIGFDMNRHRNHMKLKNPENGNTVVGEATNPQFSRSGRYSVILLDEFAFVDKSHSIWQACGDASDCRFPLSTPNGKGNKFAELALDSPISKITLHWRLHPDKDDAWYEKQKLRRTPDEIAQELDISYTRSTRGRVYGEEWDQLIADKRLIEVPYDPLLEVYTSWDFGISSTAIGFYQETSAGAVKLIDFYENSGYSIDHYVKVLFDKEKRFGYRYRSHYGDIAAKSREMGTGQTVFELLRKQGIRVIGKKIKKQDGINAVKLLLRRLWVDEGKCTKFTDAIQNYHFEWDEERMEFSQDPYHDWSCLHGDTKIRTLNGWKPIKEVRSKEWVWSYTTELHRLVPAQTAFSGMTRQNQETIEIGLDNGKSIICTPEHQFMMRDESWIEAQYLQEGDSLMPFYEVRFVKNGPIIDVYDIEVPKYHSFVAEGVVVHNSHACDQLEYFAINHRGKIAEQTRPKARHFDKYATTTY